MSFPATCHKCAAPQADFIGVEISGVYDGVAYWRCEKCGHEWHRWPKTDRIAIRLEQSLGRQFPEK